MRRISKSDQAGFHLTISMHAFSTSLVIRIIDIKKGESEDFISKDETRGTDQKALIAVVT